MVKSKRSSLLYNKKGQTGFEDILYVLAFMFASAIFLFLLYFVFGQVDDPFADALDGAIPGGETSFNVTQQNEKTLSGVGMFNTLYPFLLVGLIIFVCISLLFIDSHPAFFFVGIIILGVVILLGVVFSNIYQQITESDQFGSTDTEFSIIRIFMKYLPFVIGAIALIGMIILFSRKGGGTGGL